MQALFWQAEEQATINLGKYIVETTSPSHAKLLAEAPSALPLPGCGVVDTVGEYGTVASLLSPDAAVFAADNKLGNERSDPSDMVTVQHREHQVALPLRLFEPLSANSFRIPFAFTDLLTNSQDTGKLHISLLREEMMLQKKIVDTGRGLRISKTVVDTPQVLDHTLKQDHLTVTHVAHDCFLEPDAIPSTRYEGSTMIIPIIEEVLVVQTRLKLKEEIHITRESRTVSAQETVYLKSDQIQVSRFDKTSSQQDRRQVTSVTGTESSR